MAAGPTRADAQNPTPPPPLWPLLCSAVLVGMMIASEVRRAYRTPTTRAGYPVTGAFETVRSTDNAAAAQHERAQESGRGRHAHAPWQIPWQGWKDIFWRTYEQINEDRLLAVAAGVVFYGLLVRLRLRRTPLAAALGAPLPRNQVTYPHPGTQRWIRTLAS
jgi:hypothetical protein